MASAQCLCSGRTCNNTPRQHSPRADQHCPSSPRRDLDYMEGKMDLWNGPDRDATQALHEAVVSPDVALVS